MSVEFRSTSSDACNFYGKMKEEEAESTNGGTSSNFKKNLATGRCNRILLGVLIFVNVVVVALVIMELATTSQDDDGETSAQVGLQSSDSGAIQRLLEITKRNSNLTLDVKTSLNNDVIEILTSLRSIMGWRKSGKLFYKLNTDKVSYKTARDRCKSNGGTLAAKVLRDPTAVSQIIAGGFINPNDANTQYWVGLNDVDAEGEWGWVDGGKTNNATLRWMPGEPNDYDGNEDCANLKGEMDNRLLLNDVPCSLYYPYMCEIEILNQM